MKKLLSVLSIAVFTFSFSQTNVSVKSDKQQLEKVYNGGQVKFNKDLQNNLGHTANVFQALGDFKLNFSVDEDGKISNIKLLPELFDKSFEREVKRDVQRMKKHFANNTNQKISVALNFSREYRDSENTGALLTNDNYASSQQSFCSTK
ncbi:hypothetical protein NZ698_09120 [Chryseobacterium sp. PBS4-4]|uniref:TonB C-terminal domain-containing protein n=1 Tax=Chryseobacterium edaphi TaxID=2976532 RepID=A0ABT2W7I0_9FLAO|nr:hypothetical protein [Chryseobacterium edaphi]MCU7617359.1 hypothetical protein [Chryseobacterium edaphi]